MAGLQLTLDRPTVLFQQSVPLRIVFTNDDRARPFPLDPGSLDLLTITLFDAAGEAIASANPIVRDGRAGLDAPLDASGKIATARIPPHETAEWTEDLLVYVDVPEPGVYAVGVHFRFGGIDVTSDRVPLEVLPLGCGAIDALRDRTADNVLHVLTEHRGETATALFEFRSAHAPSQRWSGVVIDDAPAEATGVIAETDFATVESFEHDYQRWLAWAEEQALTIALVRSAGLAVRQRIEGFTGAGVFGRPVQHRDGGATVLLRTALDGLTAVRIGAEGEVRTRMPIALTESARGAALAFAVLPGRGPAWVTPAPLSLHTLDGSRVLSDELQPFAAHLETKPIASTGTPSIAVAGAVRHRKSLVFWTARSPLDDVAWQRSEWEVDHDMLPPEERLVQVCVIPALRETTAVVVTESGRVVHFPPGGPARALASVDPALASQARLVATARTIDWIAADRARGVVVTPLVRTRLGP